MDQRTKRSWTSDRLSARCLTIGLAGLLALASSPNAIAATIVSPSERRDRKVPSLGDPAHQEPEQRPHRGPVRGYGTPQTVKLSPESTKEYIRIRFGSSTGC